LARPDFRYGFWSDYWLAPRLANAAVISPGFFHLGVSLLRRREFVPADDKRQAKLAIVNDSLADRLFPNGDAIGKSVRFSFMQDYQNAEIVGIARNAHVFDLRDATTPVIFLSPTLNPD
jgi:hypothetical protein